LIQISGKREKGGAAFKEGGANAARGGERWLCQGKKRGNACSGGGEEESVGKRHFLSRGPAGGGKGNCEGESNFPRREKAD